MQIKNAGVAGYAEAFLSVQSDLQASKWYSYFENDVLVTIQWSTVKIHTEQLHFLFFMHSLFIIAKL